MARGHRESLLLRCTALSSASPCRFLPALSFIPALSQIRKIIKTRGHFPTEDAARKLLYLAITKAETKWRQVLHWPSALAAFKIQFPDRIPDSDI